VSRVIFFAAKVSAVPLSSNITGFISSMNTSHRLYCQNAYTPATYGQVNISVLSGDHIATSLFGQLTILQRLCLFR